MSPDSIGAGPPRSGSQCLPPASAAVFPSPPDSTPHICPELSRQRFCPYPPPSSSSSSRSLPTRGRSQRHRCSARRNASHVPHRECKTSLAPSAHLGGSCALSRRAAARFRLPARTPPPPRSSHRVDQCLHSAHWFCIRRPRTRVAVCKSEWVAAALRVEGERATGTASQTSTQSAIERRAVFGKAWRPNVHERRGVGSGQRKTNTQTDADVLTAADARCGNKTGRNLGINQKESVWWLIYWSGVEPAGRSRGRLVLFWSERTNCRFLLHGLKG